MTESSSGQILGASTAIGGISFLPYTFGSVWLNFLVLSIRFTAMLVVASFVILRLARLWSRARAKTNLTSAAV
jgi:amino acid permease